MTDVVQHYDSLMKDAEADLDAAGAEWLEARAAGKDCHKAEAAINEATRAFRRYEKKRKAHLKKQRRKDPQHD